MCTHTGNLTYHHHPIHKNHHPCTFSGPDTWWVYYPNASGTHQSPIDIDPSVADFDSDLAAFPLKISYRDVSSKVSRRSV